MNLLFNNNIIFIHGLWLPLCVRINYGEHVFIQPRSYSISVLLSFFSFFFLKMALTSTLTITFRTLTPDL